MILNDKLFRDQKVIPKYRITIAAVKTQYSRLLRARSHCANFSDCDCDLFVTYNVLHRSE